MVQIIEMKRAPSLGEALGAGIGQGMTQGLNMAVQDMYESRKNKRETSSLLKSIGREDLIESAGNMSPQYLIEALKYKERQDVSSQLQNLHKALSGEGVQGGTSKPTPERTLLPGQAPMLPAEQYGQGEVSQQNIPQQTDQPTRLTARQKLDNLENSWKMAQTQLSGPAMEQASKIYNQKKNQLIQEGNLEQRERSADVQERTFQSAQEEKMYKRNQAIYDKNEKQISETVNPLVEREEMNIALRPQLAAARQAVASGNTSGMFQFLSGSGFLPGMTPETGVLNYVGKEGIGSLVDRMGGRGNQYIEKMAKGAQASPGMNKQTALTIIDFQEAEMRREAKHVQVARQLAEKYSKSKKVLSPGRFKNEVNKEMKAWNEKNVGYTAYKIQQTREADYSDSAMEDRAFEPAVVPGSTPMTEKRMKALIKRMGGDEVKAAKQAQKLGYKFETQTTEPE
jgi:hypothetical protein